MSVAIAVVLVGAGVALVVHHGDSTVGNPVAVPAGYRAVRPPGAGFAMAIPAAWVDGPPQPDGAAALTLYRAHDPSGGAVVTVEAQDVGSMPVRDQAEITAANARQLGATDATVSPDASAGVAGYRVDWHRGGEFTGYVFKLAARAFTVFFRSTAAPVRTTAMGSFTEEPLPSLHEVPRRRVAVDGVRLDVPRSWRDEPGRRLDAKTQEIVIVGGVEGTAIVTRTTDTRVSPAQEVAAAKVTAQTDARDGVQTTNSRLGGQRAARLAYTTTKRNANFVTQPGYRRVYYVRRGTDTISLYLAGDDTARTDELLGEIATSFRFVAQ